ncbi:MAG: hypothetical protein ACI4P4_00130 [Faecousia sp.]
MYNRYVPQSDGTFRKSRVPEAQKAAPRKPSPPPKPPEKPGLSRPLGKPSARPPMTYRRQPPRPGSCLNKPAEPVPEKGETCPPEKEGGIGSFLRQLLPKGLCTEDIFVILLLLLMCGDNEEGKNNALLTLVIYLFL